MKSFCFARLSVVILAVLGSMTGAYSAQVQTSQPIQMLQPLPLPQTLAIASAPLFLNNPATASTETVGQSVQVKVTGADSSGNPLPIGQLPAVTVTVYGPQGVISPASITIPAGSNGTATFTYNGGFFPGPMTITAVAGHASTTAQFVGKNTVDCAGFDDLDDSVVIPQAVSADPIKDGWFFNVSIGGGPSHQVQLDTGSAGLIVGASSLGPNAIGPGAPGQQVYTSDGLILNGNFYLAPVTINYGTPYGGQSATTVPMEVLAVTSSACAKGYPKCVPETAGQISGIGMMGVGFSRALGNNTLVPDGVLGNAFTQLSPIVTGQMRPGYAVTSNRVGVGLTADDVSKFTSATQVTLTRSTTQPADWAMMQGCFGFIGLTAGLPYCGNLLMDTGIGSMILNLQPGKRPPSIASAISDGTVIAVAAPSANAAGGNPPFGYQFTVNSTNTGSSTMAPTTLRWAGSGTTPFINTGRDVINGYKYYYDAGCGRVAFVPR